MKSLWKVQKTFIPVAYLLIQISMHTNKLFSPPKRITRNWKQKALVFQKPSKNTTLKKHAPEKPNLSLSRGGQRERTGRWNCLPSNYTDKWVFQIVIATTPGPNPKARLSFASLFLLDQLI